MHHLLQEALPEDLGASCKALVPWNGSGWLPLACSQPSPPLRGSSRAGTMFRSSQHPGPKQELRNWLTESTCRGPPSSASDQIPSDVSVCAATGVFTALLP